MSKKIAFILSVNPNLASVVKFANEQEVDAMYEDAKEKMNRELENASWEG